LHNFGKAVPCGIVGHTGYFRGYKESLAAVTLSENKQLLKGLKLPFPIGQEGSRRMAGQSSG